MTAQAQKEWAGVRTQVSVRVFLCLIANIARLTENKTEPTIWVRLMDDGMFMTTL